MFDVSKARPIRGTSLGWLWAVGVIVGMAPAMVQAKDLWRPKKTLTHQQLAVAWHVMAGGELSNTTRLQVQARLFHIKNGLSFKERASLKRGVREWSKFFQVEDTQWAAIKQSAKSLKPDPAHLQVPEPKAMFPKMDMQEIIHTKDNLPSRFRPAEGMLHWTEQSKFVYARVAFHHPGLVKHVKRLVTGLGDLVWCKPENLDTWAATTAGTKHVESIRPIYNVFMRRLHQVYNGGLSELVSQAELSEWPSGNKKATGREAALTYFGMGTR